MNAINCRLCGQNAPQAFAARLLGRVDATYFRCPRCDLLQTQQPDWLASAYDKALSATDTGVVRRNVLWSRIVAGLLRWHGPSRGTFLDFAGGYGLFVRLMRDGGYDFRWQDAYTPNLLARGFEYQAGTPAAGVTAFEVLEHLVEPARFFKEIFGELQPQVFICSTQLYPWPIDAHWWYLSPATGQHVAFYRPRTLRWAAEQYGYRQASLRNLHVFSRRRVGRLDLVAGAALGLTCPKLARRKSLTIADQQAMIARLTPDQQV